MNAGRFFVSCVYVFVSSSKASGCLLPSDLWSEAVLTHVLGVSQRLRVEHSLLTKARLQAASSQADL